MDLKIEQTPGNGFVLELITRQEYKILNDPGYKIVEIITDPGSCLLTD